MWSRGDWEDVPETGGWEDIPEQGGGVTSALAHSTQGVNRAITDAFGAPVSLYSSLVGKPFAEMVTGRPQETLPGGQDSMRRGLNRTMSWVKRQLGIGDPEFKAAYDDINEVPEAYRPAVRAGEVTGATMTGLLPIAAAARGKGVYDATRMAEPVMTGMLKTPRNIWRGVVSEAALNPSTLTTRQLPVTAGTAVGAAAAEMAFPGSETAQLVGQLAGGGLGASVSASTGVAADKGGSFIQRLTEPFTTKTETGLQAAAGRVLGPKLAQAGESPDDIIARLGRMPIQPGQVAVDRAQSPLLTGVANELGKDNAQLANAVSRGRQTYASNLRTGTRDAFEPGNAAALSDVARNRAATFERNIERIIGTAEQRAVRDMGRVLPVPGTTKAGASLQQRQQIEQAVTRARATERMLWGRVDNNLSASMRNTNGVYTQVRSEMLDEQTLPSVIERAILRLSSPNASPTFGDLQRLRSEMLNQARGLRSGATPDFSMARRLDDLADGVLDDMGALNAPGVQAAREYSRILNDRLSRSFAGEVLGRKGTGAARVRPELTLEAATTGSPDKVAQQLRELQTAAVPVRVSGSQAATAMQPAQQVHQTQEQFLRAGMQQAVESRNLSAIENYMSKNQAVLDQFPDLRADLERAAQSTRALDGVLQRTGDAQRVADKTAAFAKVLRAGEDPSSAIAQILSGNTPVQDMKKIASLARTGGADSVAGLRASVLKHVTDSAMTGDTYSFAKATQLLHTPLSPNGPSLIKSLRDNGIINATQYVRIGQHLEAGLANEVSQVTGLKVGSIGSDPGMWLEAAARIVGAKIATASGAGAGGSGNSLQAAQLGANIAKKMLGTMPKTQVRAFIADAMSADDPAKLIDILARAAASARADGKALPLETTKLLMGLRAAMLPSDPTEPVWEGAPQPSPPLSITIRR